MAPACICLTSPSMNPPRTRSTRPGAARLRLPLHSFRVASGTSIPGNPGLRPDVAFLRSLGEVSKVPGFFTVPEFPSKSHLCSIALKHLPRSDRGPVSTAMGPASHL